MSDLSLSKHPSQSQIAEPAVLMIEPTILANLPSPVRGIVDQDPIIVPYDADYEELKMRVLSNLM